MKYQARKRKGAALVYVLLIMVMVSMMILTISQVSTMNTGQALTQDDSIRTYYVARSGAEVAFEAIATDARFLEGLTTSAIGGRTYEEKGMVLENGNADVMVQSTEAIRDTKNIEIGRVIEIRSVGRLDNGRIDRTVVLRFDVFNDAMRGIENVRWSY